MGLSWSHILIALMVFVLLFGTGKISGLMGDVAKGIKSFKKGITDDEPAPMKAAPQPVIQIEGQSVAAAEVQPSVTAAPQPEVR